MFDQVTLGNLALQHLGEDERIASIDESSKPARAIKTAFIPAFLFVASEANWAEFMQTVELTKRTVNADFPIALDRNAFPLPAEMLRLVEIIDPELDLEDPEAGQRYSIEGGPTGLELQVDEDGPLTVRLIRDRAEFRDPSRWSAAFAKAFQFYLAWQIADALAAKQSRRDRVLGSYGDALRLAKRVNNKTKAPKGNADTAWSRARIIGAPRAPGV
jgi:hypothetical protein